MYLRRDLKMKSFRVPNEFIHKYYQPTIIHDDIYSEI
jgi:hypothetical protein